MPPELGNLLDLNQLNLSNNHLTGTILAEFGNIELLTHLVLDGNDLTGEIPPETGQFEFLERIAAQPQCVDRRDTGRAGEPRIRRPTRFTRHLASAFLDLRGNQLSGNIPAVLGGHRGRSGRST